MIFYPVDKSNFAVPPRREGAGVDSTPSPSNKSGAQNCLTLREHTFMSRSCVASPRSPLDSFVVAPWLYLKMYASIWIRISFIESPYKNKQMIYSLTGKIVGKKENFIILETGGIGFKVFISSRSAQSLPQAEGAIKIFCSLYSRENAPFDLFGFLSEQELYLFEKLNTVSGIGPKTAMSVMSVAPIDQLGAAINEGKTELLTKASGIGKKTAERVIIDLKGKLDVGTKADSAQSLNLMESDVELEETLVSLGYTRQQAKVATAKIDPKISGFKERLKEALKKPKN